jgi:hypothetical protein
LKSSDNNLKKGTDPKSLPPTDTQRPFQTSKKAWVDDDQERAISSRGEITGATEDVRQTHARQKVYS